MKKEKHTFYNYQSKYIAHLAAHSNGQYTFTCRHHAQSCSPASSNDALLPVDADQ